MTPCLMLSIHAGISFDFAELKESITSPGLHVGWKHALLPPAPLPRISASLAAHCKMSHPSPAAFWRALGTSVQFVFSPWYKLRPTQSTSEKQTPPLLFSGSKSHPKSRPVVGPCSARDWSAEPQICWLQAGESRMWPSCLPRAHVKLLLSI